MPPQPVGNENFVKGPDSSDRKLSDSTGDGITAARRPSLGGCRDDRDEPAGVFSKRFSPRGEVFHPTSPEVGGPAFSASQRSAGELGAVLERQLLLANAEERSLASPGWRRLRGVVPLILLVVLMVGGLFGFLHFQDSMHSKINQLQEKVVELEDQTVLQRQTFERARKETSVQLENRRKENQSLTRVVERTVGELQKTFEDLQLARQENEKLEVAYREIMKRNSSAVAEFLSRLYPRWLMPKEDG